MEIYILRHGIAEDRRPGHSDSERALTPDGRKKVARVLASARGADCHPSLILSSPYKRAVETAQVAANVLSYRGEISTTAALTPDSSPQEVWKEIRHHREESAILIAGHEPLLSQLVSYLLGSSALAVNMRKGAIARIDLERLSGEPHGALQWLLTPKTAASNPEA